MSSPPSQEALADATHRVAQQQLYSHDSKAEADKEWQLLDRTLLEGGLRPPRGAPRAPPSSPEKAMKPHTNKSSSELAANIGFVTPDRLIIMANRAEELLKAPRANRLHMRALMPAGHGGIHTPPRRIDFDTI